MIGAGLFVLTKINAPDESEKDQNFVVPILKEHLMAKLPINLIMLNLLKKFKSGQKKFPVLFVI